ncbi:ABC-type nitrate/sulfonate/bicarbonate transport system, permease component [Micromonospora pattaloongensis]|uniref:ABC-type nitrate/sulfonate/bicarbonate transport system, permease component n=1 Tax=Micromonospora pattaloongensis TaxID=405436 RepID=A0A1H3KLG5_9ACTN|nr:ABC transporter permease subunit [Micromonospora pattaloongensis]SDY53033.1 ABC-type nitrate/sulfonate/bicarbonate transport system, permease component [Micromonospora pattaloongensis]
MTNVTHAGTGATGPGAVPPAGGTAARRGPRTALLGLAGLAGLLLVIEVLPHTGLVSARYLPPTSRIMVALVEQLGEAEFWSALGDTLVAWAIGLAVAVVAGIVVGVLIGAVPVLRSVTSSTIEFLRPIPSVALIPLAVLLYGTEIQSTLLLVVYASFWQVLVQVLYGVQDVDPVADETARSYGLGTWARIRHVMWPTALPYVMTGVRLAASVALVLAITAQLVIGSPGLGALISRALASNAVPAMYALVVVTGMLGVAINLIARATERRVLSWHSSVRGEVIA